MGNVDLKKISFFRRKFPDRIRPKYSLVSPSLPPPLSPPNNEQPKFTAVVDCKSNSKRVIRAKHNNSITKYAPLEKITP